MLQIRTKNKISNELKQEISNMVFDCLVEHGHVDVQAAFLTEEQSEAITTLNDRLADVLCMNAGVVLALKINQGGNQESRKAVLEFANYIDDKLSTAKRAIHTIL